ncbi:hypothetical protein ACOBV8_03220 [Pseudoalteromonas espejiana]
MQNFNISGLQPSVAELKPASIYAILAPLDNFATELALHSINKSSTTDIYIVSSQIEIFLIVPFPQTLITHTIKIEYIRFRFLQIRESGQKNK